MIKNKSGTYQFSSFLAFPHVIHGFSTRAFGSFAREEIGKSIPDFAKSLSISPDDIVCMEQVHGKRVMLVSHLKGTIIPEADGLAGSEEAHYVCVRSADCVPILAVDPTSSIYGVAHAGWKGALGNIAEELIQVMLQAGAKSHGIYIGLGPSIRVCCYAIDTKRAEYFVTSYPKLADTILEKRDGTIYLNLQKLVIEQLKDADIEIGHIEDSSICTHDRSDEFYSFRDKKSQGGLFAGIIGMR